MPAEDNKQAARRFYEEVINARDLDVIDELLTPDGVDHTFGSQNAEEAKQFFGMLYQAFPDLRAEVNDVIAEGDLVAARVTYSGTHEGEFVGIPPPASRPPPTGSTSSGCRTASRPSTGAVRTWPASRCSWRPAWTSHVGTRHARLAVVAPSRSALALDDRGARAVWPVQPPQPREGPVPPGPPGPQGAAGAWASAARPPRPARRRPGLGGCLRGRRRRWRPGRRPGRRPRPPAATETRWAAAVSAARCGCRAGRGPLGGSMARCAL